MTNEPTPQQPTNEQALQNWLDEHNLELHVIVAYRSPNGSVVVPKDALKSDYTGWEMVREVRAVAKPEPPK